MADLLKYLPTTRKEMELRGWDEVDIVFFTGDAYIDHPSFGAAVLGRVLEAAGYRVAILNGMESGKAYTITDLMKSVAEIAELSNQRVSAIVRQMIESGDVVRKEVKRRAYFTKVEK